MKNSKAVIHRSRDSFPNHFNTDFNNPITLNCLLTFFCFSWSLTLSKSTQRGSTSTWTSAWLTHNSTASQLSANSFDSWSASRSCLVFSPAADWTLDQLRFVSAKNFWMLCFSTGSDVCLIRSPPLVRRLSSFCLKGANSETSSWKTKGCSQKKLCQHES